MVWAVVAIAVVAVVAVVVVYKIADRKGFDEGYKQASWDSIDLC